jgi:hypothetical protein
MYIHHLFAYPNRIISPSTYYPVFSFINLEGLVGSFGEICVPIFLFLSGYGFSIMGPKDTKYYFVKIFTFFQVYWFYCVIFVPLGFIFFKDVTLFGSQVYRYEISFRRIIANLTGLSSSYNSEWWFVRIYIILLILTPLINKIKKHKIFIALTSCFLFIISDFIGKYGFDTPVISIRLIFFWQAPFIMGYILAFYNFDKLVNQPYFCLKIFTFFSLIIITSLLSYSLKKSGLILSTPIFIVCIILLRSVTKIMNKPIGTIGIYSFPMWLIHSFFCYYYLQWLIFLPKYSIFILANLLLVTFFSSYFLEKIRIYINYQIKKQISHFAKT